MVNNYRSVFLAAMAATTLILSACASNNGSADNAKGSSTKASASSPFAGSDNMSRGDPGE